ncbi:hypothetical protein PFLUV_G00156960 [Perca fluviatilis]|uniref:Uncharacterized protein n=1 Tax=Perca fluviatilis TaxID=8168 RepID=A0A6A5EZQ0_PERFL|nr:hypothetical protein PFLUV_G00156960 [Perca fluviatilis]
MSTFCGGIKRPCFSAKETRRIGEVEPLRKPELFIEEVIFIRNAVVNYRSSPVRREPWEKPQTRSKLDVSFILRSLSLMLLRAAEELMKLGQRKTSQSTETKRKQREAV